MTICLLHRKREKRKYTKRLPTSLKTLSHPYVSIYFSCFAQIIVKTAPGHFSMICVDMLSRLNHPVDMCITTVGEEKDIVSDATIACDHFCIPTQQKTAKVCKGRQASVFLVCA